MANIKKGNVRDRGGVVAATRDVRHLKGIIGKQSKPVSVEEMNRAAKRAGSR